MKSHFPASDTNLKIRLATVLSGVFIAAFSFVTLGCAERPTSQINTALEALWEARLAGAEDYAVERLIEAENSFQRGIDELDNQDERIFLLRNYSLATAFLSAACSQAEKARAEAFINWEETKINAQIALSTAKHHMLQAKQLLNQTLPAFVSHTLLQEWHLALQQGEQLLEESEAGLSQGDFIQVMTNAHTVETMALRVHQQFLIALPSLPLEQI